MTRRSIPLGGSRNQVVPRSCQETIRRVVAAKIIVSLVESDLEPCNDVDGDSCRHSRMLSVAGRACPLFTPIVSCFMELTGQQTAAEIVTGR